MGDLIVMSRSRPVAARETREGHNAEILFFTGVRYYRMEEGGASPSTQPALAELAPPKRRRSPEQRRASKRPRVEPRLEIPA